MQQMSLFAELRKADAEEARCYLLGALRDGTFNRLHNTVRIVQADIRWLRALRVLLWKLGSRSWIYREGARNVWVIETTCRLRHGRKLHGDRHFQHGADGHFHIRTGFPKSLGGNDDVIGPREQVIHPELSAWVSHYFALHGGFSSVHRNLRGRDAASARILDYAAERATRILRMRYATGSEHHHEAKAESPQE